MTRQRSVNRRSNMAAAAIAMIATSITYLGTSKSIVTVVNANEDQQQVGCTYDGNKFALVGEVIHAIGYQCETNNNDDGGVSKFFSGEEVICTGDEQVERTKLSMYECPDNTFCDMCGPPRRGAAQCVEETFESRGVQCNFESTYKSQGCFTYEANFTVVPEGSQIGQSTFVGCTDDNKLIERMVSCSSTWERVFVDETVSCPPNLPTCVEGLGTASCESLDEEVTPYVTTDTADGGGGGGGVNSELGNGASTAQQEDGCVKGNILIKPNDIYGEDQYECISDTHVATLVQTCQSGGNVVGMTQDKQCPQGIRPTCYQCGSKAQCLNTETDTIPDGCVRGSEYVDDNTVTGGDGTVNPPGLDGDDNKDTSGGGGGTSNSGNGGNTTPNGPVIGEIRCIDSEKPNISYSIGEEIERIGFKCTGGSMVEGKIIMCGPDGKPTKGSSLIAFDCPNNQPCYQCGFSAAPGAAVCANTLEEAQERSYDLVKCELGSDAFDQNSISGTDDNKNDNSNNNINNVGSSGYLLFGNTTTDATVKFVITIGSMIVAMFMV